jgi:[ribosomal protein S5]-alanine N-acetyltransferase
MAEAPQQQGVMRMIFGTIVVLGPILPVDIPSLFAWSDDLDDARLNEPYRPLNWHRQEAYWMNAEGDASRVFFAIRSRSAPEIIGYVQIRDIHPIHRSAVIGLRIGEARARGQGFGGEALQLAIRYCRDHLNLTRLTLSVFARNDRAIALYRSAGFRQEGVMARALFIDGGWIDLVMMALVDPDRYSAS